MSTTLLPNGVSYGVSSSFQIPLSTTAETLARSTFTQLMWALSYPGRRYRLPGMAATSVATTFASCIDIGNSLLDLETSYFSPDTLLATTLARTGARHLSAANAAYHFYPDLTTLQRTTELITHASEAQVGTLLYPDQAATLIIGCRLGIGTELRLRGPGIASEVSLSVGGLPPAFWQLRDERVTYPIGWDLFLLDGAQVVGLPRTTVVEQKRAESEA